MPSDYECAECKDTGSLLRKVKVWQKDRDVLKDLYSECHCQEQKHLQNRFKNALIPEEFQDSRFDNYEQKTDVQKLLFNSTKDYLKEFSEIIESRTKHNSLGFIAVFGETLIRSMSGEDKYRAKSEHNNFGLGKTHLQMAAAKWILNNVRVFDEIAPGQKSELDRGCRVLCVSDITFMEELAQSKMLKDEGETHKRLLHGAINADVLVWDDLGKAKWTETREGLYYQIINERYNHKRPIIFSSNEDKGTLSDKIGFAASSRLFGMCGDRLYRVEGSDYRQRKEVG